MVSKRVFTAGARENVLVPATGNIFGDFIVYRAEEDILIVGWELNITKQLSEAMLGNDGVLDAYLELGYLSTVMSPGNLAQVLMHHWWNSSPASVGIVNGHVAVMLPKEEAITMRDGESIEGFYGGYNNSAAARSFECTARVYYIKGR